MADLDFERRMNPWLFDSSGNLTDQAKQQFPDLASAPGPVAFTGGGSGLSVQPAALSHAGQQALGLQPTVKAECDEPALNVTAAVGALTGWSTSGALNTAWSVWTQQVQALVDDLAKIGQNLQVNAANYTNIEYHVQRSFRLS
ncbi:hypothetical protein [Kitasatospora sp. LaBMicrA B282]|uniref:hypothetical protein n=1 Tax=Kitasatospora sp. LaBMicrA B282 TaxID=3420949 RepID=UPI003D13D76E